jgi:hypothetical protein
LNRVGRSGLLAIAKSGVSNEKLVSRVNGDKFVVEIYPAYLLIRKYFSLKVWLRHILESVDPEFTVLMFQYPLVFIPPCHNFTYMKKVYCLSSPL